MISFIDKKHERATTILAAIRGKPGISSAELSSLLDLTPSMVSKYLSSFSGYDWIDVEDVGNKKFYQITPKGCNALGFFRWMCEPGVFREISIKVMDVFYNEGETDPYNKPL